MIDQAEYVQQSTPTTSACMYVDYMQHRKQTSEAAAGGRGLARAWQAWAWVLLVALAQLTFGRVHRKSRQALLISIPCLDSCGLSASVLCALLPRRGAAIRSHPVTQTVPSRPPAISVYHSQQSDGGLLVLDYDMSYGNKTPSATWPKTLSPSGVAPFRTA